MKLLDKLLLAYKKKQASDDQRRELFDLITTLTVVPDQLDSIGAFLAQFSVERPDSLPFSVPFVTMVLEHFGINTVQKDNVFWQQELVQFCVHLYLGGYCSVPETPIRLKLAVMRFAPVLLDDNELLDALTVDQLIQLCVPRDRQSMSYYFPSVDFMQELGAWTTTLLEYSGSGDQDLIERIKGAKQKIHNAPIDFLLYLQARQQKGQSKSPQATQSGQYIVKPSTFWLPITSLEIQHTQISYFKLRFGEYCAKICASEIILASDNGKKLALSVSLEDYELFGAQLDRQLNAELLPLMLRAYRQNSVDMSQTQLSRLMDVWQIGELTGDLCAAEYIKLWVEAAGKYHNLCERIARLIYRTQQDPILYLQELQSQPLLLTAFLTAPLRDPLLLDRGLDIARRFDELQEKAFIHLEGPTEEVFEARSSFDKLLVFLAEARKVCIIQNMSEVLSAFRQTQYFTAQSIAILKTIFEDYVGVGGSLLFVKTLDAINCAIVRVAFHSAREKLVPQFETHLGMLFLDALKKGSTLYLFDALKAVLLPHVEDEYLESEDKLHIDFNCHRSKLARQAVELLPVDLQLQLVFRQDVPMYPFYFTQESVSRVTETRDDWALCVHYALMYSTFQLTDTYVSMLDDEKLILLASYLDSEYINDRLLDKIHSLPPKQLEKICDYSRNYLNADNHLSKVGHRFASQSHQLQQTESLTVIGLLRLKSDNQPFLTLLGNSTQVKMTYVLNQFVVQVILHGQVVKYSVDFDSQNIFCNLKLVLDLKKTGFVALMTNGQLRLFVGLKKTKVCSVETLFYGNGSAVFHSLSTFYFCLPISMQDEAQPLKVDEIELGELHSIAADLSALDSIMPKSLQLYYGLQETKLVTQQELVEGNVVSNIPEFVRTIQLFNHSVERDAIAENAAACKISVFSANIQSNFYSKVKQYASEMQELRDVDKAVLSLELFPHGVCFKDVFDKGQFMFKNTMILNQLSLNPFKQLAIIEQRAQELSQEQLTLLTFIFVHSVVSYEQNVQVQTRLVERLLGTLGDAQRTQALNYLIQQKFFGIAVNLIISPSLVISQSTIKALERSVLALNLDSFEQMIVEFKQLGILNYLLETYELQPEEQHGLLQTFFIFCATRSHIQSVFQRGHEAFLLSSFKLCYSQQKISNNSILFVPTAMPLSHVFTHVQQFIIRVKHSTIIEATRNLNKDNCSVLLPLIFMLIEQEYTNDYQMIDQFIIGLVSKFNEMQLTQRLDLKCSHAQLKYLITCCNKQEGVVPPLYTDLPVELQIACPFIEDILSLEPIVFSGTADEGLMQGAWALQQGEFCFAFPRRTGPRGELSYGQNDLAMFMLMNQLNNTSPDEVGSRSRDELAEQIVAFFGQILKTTKGQHDVSLGSFVCAVLSLIQGRGAIALVMEKLARFVIQENLSSADYDSFSLTDKKTLLKMKLIRPDLAELYQIRNAGGFVVLFRALSMLLVKGMAEDTPDLGAIKCAFLRVACRLGLCNKVMKMAFLAVFQQAYITEPTSHFTAHLFEVARATEWLPKLTWPGKVLRVSEGLRMYVSKYFQTSTLHQKQLSSPTITLETTFLPEKFDTGTEPGLELVWLSALLHLYEEKLNKAPLDVQNQFSQTLIELETNLMQAPDVKTFFEPEEEQQLLSASDDNDELKPASQQQRWANFFNRCSGAADAQAQLVFQECAQSLAQAVAMDVQDYRQEYIPMNQAYPCCLMRYKLVSYTEKPRPVGLWKSFIDIDGAKRMLQRSFLCERNEALRHEIKALNQFLTFPDELIAHVFNVVIHEQTFGCIESLILVTNRQLIIVPHLYYNQDYLMAENVAIGFSLDGNTKEELQKIVKQPLDHASVQTAEKKYREFGEAAPLERHSFDASFIKYFLWTDIIGIERVQISGRANGLLISTTFQSQICLVFSDQISSWNDRLRALRRQKLFSGIAATLEDGKVPRLMPVIVNSVAHRELAASLMIYFANTKYELGPVDFVEGDHAFTSTSTRFLEKTAHPVTDFLQQLVREDVCYQVRYLLYMKKQYLTPAYTSQSIGPLAHKKIRFGVPILDPQFVVASPQSRKPDKLALWYAGLETGLEMLLRVNRLAQRTELSLSNYPIIPWPQERDFAYPPAAQLEETRAMLQEKYASSGLFNVAQVTSSAPIAIYFAIRLQPFEASMRHLQNKQYDAPDRLFRGFDVTKAATLKGGAGDNRELTPDVLFLPVELNFHGFQFGELQDGALVDNCEDFQGCILRQQTVIRELNRESNAQGLKKWLAQQFGERQRSNEWCNVYPSGNYPGPDLDFDAASSFGVVPPRCLEVFSGDSSQDDKEQTRDQAGRLSALDGPETEILCDFIQVCTSQTQYTTGEKGEPQQVDVWGRSVETQGVLQVLRHNTATAVIEKGYTVKLYLKDRPIATIRLSFAPVVMEIYGLCLYAVDARNVLRVLNGRSGDTLWDLSLALLLGPEPCSGIRIGTDQSLIFLSNSTKVCAISQAGIIIAYGPLRHSGSLQVVQENERIFLLQQASERLRAYELCLVAGEEFFQDVGIPEMSETSGFIHYDFYHPALRPFQALQQERYSFRGKMTSMCSIKEVGWVTPRSPGCVGCVLRYDDGVLYQSAK